MNETKVSELFFPISNPLNAIKSHLVDVNDYRAGGITNMNSKSEVWPNGMPETGQTASRSRQVTTKDIELFTEISGDRNPIHYDKDIAEATRFGGIVVQGGVTSAILNAVVAEDLPGPGTVFLQVNWSFKAPVRPGDTITGEVTITKVRDDKPITELDTRIVIADGTVVLVGSAVCYTFPVKTH
jgi:acyl dehydratase